MTPPKAPSSVLRNVIGPKVPGRALVEHLEDDAPRNDLARNAAQVEAKNKAATLDPYQITIGGVVVDPYRIAREYDLCPVITQAVKKLLRCGRKHKSKAQDVREAITTLLRWEEMEREDNNTPEPA